MALEITNPHGVNIKMSEFTDNVVSSVDPDNIGKLIVTGDGILDILMNTATTHLKAQLDSNRIRGEDYANSYVQVYQATLAAAVQIWLQKPIADLQRESEEAKKELYYRQIEGFDEDYSQKLFKIMMDAWSVGFSVARDNFEAEGIPGPMQKGTIDEYFNKIVIPNTDSYEYGRKRDSLRRGPVSKVSVEMDEEQKAYLKVETKPDEDDETG